MFHNCFIHLKLCFQYRHNESTAASIKITFNRIKSEWTERSVITVMCSQLTLHTGVILNIRDLINLNVE